MSVTAQWAVQAEFAGTGNGWTDITAHIRIEDNVKVQYGIRGVTATDRVAGTGTMVFTLNNRPLVGGQYITGYYSPDSVNCRQGFQIGIRIRLALTYPRSACFDAQAFNASCFDTTPPLGTSTGAFDQTAFDTTTFFTSAPVTTATTIYKFLGTLDSVKPTAGVRGRYLSLCTVVDWLDEAARYHVTGVSLLTNVTGDVVFSDVVATMPIQPAAIQTSAGLDTYPYALDNVKDETTTAMQIFQDLALSELGYVYIKSDQTQGGTLTYESRSTRGKVTSNVQVFSNTMEDVQLMRSRNTLLNKVQVMTHPRKVDIANTTVLFKLDAATLIAGGTTVVLQGPFRDPAQPLARVGGTSMQQPVASTDYKVNTAADGSGADLTANFSITSTYTSNTATLTVVNNSVTPGYIGGGTAGAFLQCRGQGVYDYNTAVLKNESVSNQQQYGQRVITIDMPYQADALVGDQASSYILNVYSNPLSNITRLSILGNWSDALMTAVLLRDISDSVGLDETITGVKGTTRYFINGVDLELSPGPAFRSSYILAPADQNRYWYLEIVGSSELDQTTRLGYGLIVGHNDVAHADLHFDTAHSDVAFIDVAHLDVAHTDSSHGDTAHTDVAHGDVTHGDSHSDQAHVDTPFVNSHTDTPHSDTAFVNTHGDAHTDNVTGSHGEGHADQHNDSHGDVPFANQSFVSSHGDTAFVNTSFVNVHTDAAHTDAAHKDVAHTDASVHQDAGHQDTPHSDTAHQDVTHIDIHSDTSHGDQ